MTPRWSGPIMKMRTEIWIYGLGNFNTTVSERWLISHKIGCLAKMINNKRGSAPPDYV